VSVNKFVLVNLILTYSSRRPVGTGILAATEFRSSFFRVQYADGSMSPRVIEHTVVDRLAGRPAGPAIVVHPVRDVHSVPPFGLLDAITGTVVPDDSTPHASVIKYTVLYNCRSSEAFLADIHRFMSQLAACGGGRDGVMLRACM